MIHKLRNLIDRWRYGTLFEALQYRLESVGIVIAPYYWIQEGAEDIDLSQMPGGFEDYSFDFFGPDEIQQILASKTWNYTEDKLSARLKKGEKCFGAKYRGEIVAFMWMDFDEWFIKKHRVKLNKNEAYLLDMYTMKPFRGKGIAPYLRYRSYQFLKEAGMERLFSYSDFFNSPSIRFKKKLNARFLKFGLYVELFNRYHWNWILKDLHHSNGR